MVKLFWIPLLPLLGSFINGLWVLIAVRSHRIPRRLPIAIIANVAAFGSFLFSLIWFFQLLKNPSNERVLMEHVFDWIQVGNLQINFSLLLDPLSALMILIVTGVGSFIHLYSIGYMSHDEGQGRFFVYLNLFLVAMLILVLADSLPLMFVGWEGVGLCSYLLIGFWFKDEKNAKAGKKAFIVNRVGDLAFLLGMFLVFVTFGTLHFQGMKEVSLGMVTVPSNVFWVCLLLFIGACGKSAQFPLHVWLPDAMAGPTPVSALIHAATMVTAGVYLIARLSFLYFLVPEIGIVIVSIGTFTALMASLIALVQDDIKKILAYSTISQLGYMFLAVGVGAYGVGIFHLMTHAFFKGLLFLGAGSVIHAVSNEQNIQKMGGLAKKIPITFWTFLIGSLALIGLPPLSGFFSKDEILWKTLEGGYSYPYIIGLITALLTAIYMTRLIYLTFFGECRLESKIKEKVHESPLTMTLPLTVLAFFSILSGFWGLPHYISKFFGSNVLEHFLGLNIQTLHYNLAPNSEGAFQEMVTKSPPMGEFSASLLAVVVALFGLGLCFWIYHQKLDVLKKLPFLRFIHKVFSHNFYLDEFYQKFLINPLYWISKNGFWMGLDVFVIDGLINSLGKFIARLGVQIRLIQTGRVRNYIFSIALGLVILIGYILWD